MNKRLPSLSKYCKAKYPRYTVWVGEGIDESGNENILMLGRDWVDGDYCDDIGIAGNRKLSMRYPKEFVASKSLISSELELDAMHAKSSIRMVPILSTERGWKWNRRQLISYLTKYTWRISQTILGPVYGGGYNLLTGDQQMMRRIFGKHLPAVIREINLILKNDPDFSRHKGVYICRYSAYDMTPHLTCLNPYVNPLLRCKAAQGIYAMKLALNPTMHP